MSYCAEEVSQYVSEEDVKFIRLAFCDVFGKQKNVSVMPFELSRAFRDGVPVSGRAAGLSPAASPAWLLLRPESDTLTPLPWRPEHGRVVRMLCRLLDETGRPFPADTRAILEETVRDAGEAGLDFSFSARCRFYLFKRDEAGDPTGLPYDRAGYLDIAPEDKGENVRREICLTLEQMGIRPEASYHEAGPGQNAIEMPMADPLTAADRLSMAHTVIATVAARNGLFADFSACPLPDAPANRLPVIFSVKSRQGIAVQESAAAGVCLYIKEMMPYLSPCGNSGVYLFAKNQKEDLLFSPVSPDKTPCTGLMLPDGGANPYLAFALLLRAAVLGVQKGETELPAPQLPATPGEGKEAAANGALGAFLPACVKEAFGVR
ncbi:MAG: glutamine synthetase beta-grasp domain-containing protein [Clostridia bacterium]|nr:glutamine synthetase beta-grasp domain-containing protein [Clostridia bacterium]